ncbi:protein translocase subunit SecF [Blochmannia endosymbiont of Camponotus (Colobopsis) obliquus]|uniref:protein translocase subunit SecF n=1 Tax=Blochmannia endosymbiont of Camponotus (Colobopsis) obliquus TaxID=1505597 RepID=UPI0023A96B1D|nr:protein translocase subunit SecF [Blochmannia endosymbiont of Camponotus (Colobopsis) obliquus]
MDFIGPGVGNDLMRCAGISFVLSLLCIFAYVNICFRWHFAVGAVLALVHDVVIIIGVLSLLFIEINTIIISALIFVFCYSLNDSIVIFDRIRENCYLYYDRDIVEIFNISLTQVLKRTFITSFTTAAVLLILLIFGGSLLRGFVTTLLVGVFVGTFSSIYIASALAFQLSKNK